MAGGLRNERTGGIDPRANYDSRVNIASQRKGRAPHVAHGGKPVDEKALGHQCRPVREIVWVHVFLNRIEVRVYHDVCMPVD